MTQAVLYQCPCCGYLTLPERGRHEICPVCCWHDDADEERFGVVAPERPEGPNSCHLWEARLNFLAFGASTEHRKASVRSPLLHEYPADTGHR
jgi:hypothetical protein